MALEIILFISVVLNVISWVLLTELSDKNTTLNSINDYLRVSNDSYVKHHRDLEKDNADLQAFKDHHVNLWAIDVDPKEVSLAFIRDNAHQIK